MVGKLSDLADFLQDDALSADLTKVLIDRQQEISASLEKGESVSIPGPNGEVITIAPAKSAGPQ
jgi:hypothetical protein